MHLWGLIVIVLLTPAKCAVYSIWSPELTNGGSGECAIWIVWQSSVWLIDSKTKQQTSAVLHSFNLTIVKQTSKSWIGFLQKLSEERWSTIWNSVTAEGPSAGQTPVKSSACQYQRNELVSSLFMCKLFHKHFPGRHNKDFNRMLDSLETNLKHPNKSRETSG